MRPIDRRRTTIRAVATVSFADMASVAGGRRTRKTSELVARDLASYIVDNDLPVGTRLPTERELVEVLGVGRTTLREALRLLESRGVISIRAGRQGGPVVRRPRANDLGEALTLVLQFEKASLDDVIQARIAIEPTVARLAAANATPEQLARMQESIDRTGEDLDDHANFLRQTQVFHATMAEAAGNALLGIFIDSIKQIADAAVASGVKYTRRRRKAVMDVHQQILDALTARDGDIAAKAMADHMTEARRFWRTQNVLATESTVRWSG